MSSRTMRQLCTPDEAVGYLRANYPELEPRVSSSQVSFWLQSMGRRGRVVRVSQDGGIKRTATVLRLAGNAAAGFDDHLPMAVAYLEALIAGELRVLRHEAKVDRAQLVTVREIDAMLARIEKGPA